MGDTSIQWTEKTWNPIRGCSVISPGCINCYAMKQAHRFSGDGKPYAGLTKQTKAGPQWTGKVMLAGDHLTDPLSWRKPSRVFVNSMSDLFHKSVPDEWIDSIFAVMACAQQHTFQILTKRADRMRAYMSRRATSAQYWKDAARQFGWALEWEGISMVRFPLPNVWLGVSVEDQKHADARIPLLLQTPAAIRFISAEPLLGPVQVSQLTEEDGDAYGDGAVFVNAMTGERWMRDGFEKDQPSRPPLNWVIVGGESGPGARPFDTSFARSIVKQCADAEVACFVKQLGAHPEQPVAGAWNSAQRERMVLRDRKGGDMSEWPTDLRVRQFPKESQP